MSRIPVLLTLDYPPQQGGVARYLSQLVRAWGSSVRVLVPRGSASTALPEVREAMLLGRGPCAWLPAVFAVWRARPEASFFLVSHVLPMGTAVWLASLVRRVPYGVMVHGLDIVLAQRSAWKRWLVGKIFARGAAVMTNSEAVAHRLRAWWPGVEPVVITPGVEPRAFLSRKEARALLGISSAKKVVVTIGRLISRKGMDTAIQAMRHLPGVELVIVGDGPERERLERLAHLCAPGRVRFAGEVSDEERDTYLAAADVFTFLPRDEERDIEGFGIVCLEAALAGLPVVATQAGGVGEAFVHQKTGLAVAQNSPLEAAQAIQSLLDNPVYARELGSAGRIRAQELYTWSSRAAQVRSLFSSLEV